MYRYVNYIKKLYLRQCPWEEKELRKKTEDVLRKVLAAGTAAALFVLCWNLFLERTISLYSIGCALFMAVIVGIELPEREIQKTEEKLYFDMLRYFAAVKHKYLSCRNIPNAVQTAAEDLGQEIRLHAVQIGRILTESKRKERVRSYVLAPEYNRYLKLFLIQAYEASERGDSETDSGASLFSENMEYLRMEVMQEIYRRRKRRHELSGYSFVAVAPVFTMSVLKGWGVSFTGELEPFYLGAGRIVVLLCFIATVAVYSAIRRAREVGLQQGGGEYLPELSENRYVKKMLGKLEKTIGTYGERLQRLLLEAGEYRSLGSLLFKMLCYGGSVVLFGLWFFASLYAGQKENLLTKIPNIDTVVFAATQKQKEVIAGHILALTGEYCQDTRITKERIAEEFRHRMYLPNENTVADAASEVMRRIAAYRNAFVKWYEYTAVFLAGLAAAGLPVWELYYRRKLILAGTIYEIKQFQAVLIMERCLAGMTIPELLEDMEASALVFRPILRTCINSYSAGPERALRQMKETGGKLHEAFAELADGFLAVDEVGIPAAFAEMENNRSMLEKMSQLEADIRLEQKKDSTDTLSKLPMYLVVGVYFVIPFLMVSLSGVWEVFTMLEEMQ